ncbi:MAG: hydantoinase/oxoprolinase family protein [Proteobacteria bacterium]|jgi:N-methylhydantoinase A|nr:hydantoinase/oxoprolinase family protein [Pseudomonadota bacterium]MDA0850956.1 hydantoinase/oxoprolinase family protein [Pseudomonadota bacterium]MDA1295308.1 hydantoinase/oxoprolinase family protein [Pseudomonadota bacterium]
MTEQTTKASQSRYIIGVDVGGTFTDLFFVDQQTGEAFTGKLPSTLENQSIGLIEGILRALPDFSGIDTIVHGTTVGTNALLERKGSQTGLITTEGFEDVLEMRRRDRPETWGLRGDYRPVIQRNLRLGVAERTLASGQIERPLDEQAVLDRAKALLEAGCEALCIAFINSYANSENEQRAGEIARSVWPNDHVTVSSDILPEIREFERVSTAVLNAYLQPKMARYLNQLGSQMRQNAFEGDILIVQSNGGVMTLGSAADQPVRTALSGPAAGVIAARFIGQSAGFDNLITCDMGGTSFDVSVVAEGRSALAAQSSIDFGMVVRTPMIEINTIGAGGGSIAWIDGAGLLQIGPQSAGSNPGPVCYGLGNEDPTVTDANLVLGRINADRPIGGKLDRLDVDKARRAIKDKIALPLGISDMEAAEAIIQVANARMAGAIRIVSIERGHDPAKFTAMPFGGGGALHIGALIREVGLKSGLVPRYPGVTSALGCVIADMRHDAVKTINRTISDLNDAELLNAAETLWQTCHARITASETAVFDAIEEDIEADMLYAGQTHSVQVKLAGRHALNSNDLKAAFEEAYRAQIGQPLDNIPIRLINLRVAAVAKRPNLDLRAMAPKDGVMLQDAFLEMRSIWADGIWQEAPVYDRLALGVGQKCMGPALLEQADTTIFVDPGLIGEVDEFGNLIILPEA